MGRGPWIASAVSVLALSIQPLTAQRHSSEATFTRDVAPVLFEHCASCHQPEGVAPFSLLTFEEARPRARNILASVKSRRMPPWQPDHGDVHLVGERRLSDEQIEVIERWVNEGAHEGNRGDLPPPPAKIASGWQLGVPDLVLTLPEYVLAAGTVDELRNFTIAMPGNVTRYVRGLEFRPGSRAVHHANIYVDRSPGRAPASRPDDPISGYLGAIPRSAVMPEGFFLGWTPGQAPPLAPQGQAWRLEAGSSFLLRLHLTPTDRPERMRPSIGLYFSEEPTIQTLAMLRLGRQDIDISPGQQRYVATDSFVLPVDVQIQAVQPHAHYRARSINAWATLPDGTRRPLLRISHWDFYWQDQYRYEQPFWLPAGTTVTSEYTFDNSVANRQNPDRPPKRVQWGQRSADEMADFWMQMLARTDRDRETLGRSLTQKMASEDVVGYESLIARPVAELPLGLDPIVLRNDVALLYLDLGKPDRAVEHFQAVAMLQPGAAAPRVNLAAAFEAAGKKREAIAQLREALHVDSSSVRVRNRLAGVLLGIGETDEALGLYREAARLAPEDSLVENNLGGALIQAGRPLEAVLALRRALGLDPDNVQAHYNLAHAHSLAGHPMEAVGEFQAALRVRPDWLPALRDLAWLRATSADPDARNPTEAVRLASRAAALAEQATARDPSVLDTLAAAYASAGRFDDARRTAEAAAQMADAVAPELANRVRERLRLYQNRQSVIR